MQYIRFFYFLSLGITSIINAQFKLGLENISDSFVQKLHLFRSHGARIGLITNHTGKDQTGNRNVDVLLKRGLHIAYIFAPEHGFDGTIPAAHEVKNSHDYKTHIPIISLYGKGTEKKITHHKMYHVDVLMFDMQDVGMRHYTYVSTLLHAMQTAAEHDKHFVILDRPNPLGAQMEGPVVSPEIQRLNSFIAAAPIPLRHGMTVGELAWYFNSHILKKPAKLHVIKMQDYDRRIGLHTELQENISPNIQSKQACYGYSFLGLLGEVRPFSVGLGSDRAFSCFALPNTYVFSKYAWQRLQNLLKSAGIISIPYTYRSKRTKTCYQGLQMYIDNINVVSSFDVFLQILKLVKNKGVPLKFSEYFNRAVGTHAVQDYIIGKITKSTLARSINKNLQQFFKQARNSFMYLPLPTYHLMQE